MLMPIRSADKRIGEFRLRRLHKIFGIDRLGSEPMQIVGWASTCVRSVLLLGASLALGVMAWAGDPTGYRDAGAPRQTVILPSRVGKKALSRSLPIRQVSGRAGPVAGTEQV